MHLLKAANDNANNNLNLLRFLAATVVFLNHCFPLTGQKEPFSDSLGITLGTIAVDIFFVISGFLVTKSIVKSSGGKSFIYARALRIYPGLMVAIMVAIVMGAIFTTYTFVEYIKNPQTFKYFIKGVTLLAGVEMQLPGVFTEAPFPNAVNGSLWTLIYEVKMYLLLLFLWKVANWIKCRFTSEQILVTIVPLLTIIALVYFFSRLALHLPESHLNRFIYLFFSGSTFYLYRKRVYLEKWFFWTALGLLFILPNFGKLAFSASYILLVPYMVVYCSFVPNRVLRQFNHVGDYSYGIYIYSFPIQQAVVTLFPKVNPVEMMMICSPIIMTFACLSWHFIEKKFLAIKKRL